MLVQYLAALWYNFAMKVEVGLTMKMLNRFLFVLHAIVGIGAMAGGMGAILNPSEPMGMSVEALKNSPFSDFLIPGIILFVVIGLGNVISAITILLKPKFQAYISSVFSGALVIWIIVQCIMLGTIHYLHVIFFIIGLIEAVLSIIKLFKQSLFPANIIINYYKKARKEVR